MELLTATQVLVPFGDQVFDVALEVPTRREAVVVLARSGDGDRARARSEAIAAELHRREIATAQIDLLTAAEAAEPEYRFNSSLAGSRLAEIMRCLRARQELEWLPLGLLGAGTAAAAAVVACQTGVPVRAFVSLGGRPELAGLDVDTLSVPSLFIVGAHDWGILVPNEEASERVKGPAKLAVVPLATRFFEEEGTLEEAAHLASEWFRHWMVEPGGAVAE